MAAPKTEARIVALEIALDALLAELDELRQRLDAHERQGTLEAPEIRLA